MNMFQKIQVALLLCSATFIAAAENGTKTLAEIEAALNPLDVVANHGGVRRSIDLNIRFALNSAQLQSGSDQQVLALGKAISESGLRLCNIMLIGHTDATGSDQTNMALSQARANTIKSVLVDQFGLDANNLHAEGMGELQLLDGLATNDPRHRRVEITLADVDACKAAMQSQSQTEEKSTNMQIQW